MDILNFRKMGITMESLGRALKNCWRSLRHNISLTDQPRTIGPPTVSWQ